MKASPNDPAGFVPTALQSSVAIGRSSGWLRPHSRRACSPPVGTVHHGPLAEPVALRYGGPGRLLDGLRARIRRVVAINLRPMLEALALCVRDGGGGGAFVPRAPFASLPSRGLCCVLRCGAFNFALGKSQRSARVCPIVASGVAQADLYLSTCRPAYSPYFDITL